MTDEQIHAWARQSVTLMGVDVGRRLFPPLPPLPRPQVASPYLDITEAAEYTHLSVQTLKNNSRYITRAPGTRRWLATREALDNFLNARRRRRRS